MTSLFICRVPINIYSYYLCSKLKPGVIINCPNTNKYSMNFPLKWLCEEKQNTVSKCRDVSLIRSYFKGPTATSGLEQYLYELSWVSSLHLADGWKLLNQGDITHREADTLLCLSHSIASYQCSDGDWSVTKPSLTRGCKLHFINICKPVFNWHVLSD